MKALKHIYNLALGGLLLTACEQNKVGLYDGPDEAFFIKTSGSIVVDEANPTYTIEIGTSNVHNSERTYTIEVDTDQSSASEGFDFEFITNTVTILANEATGMFEVKGLYNGVSPDGRTAVFKITSSSEGIADYKQNFALDLFKFCSFDLDAFIGNYQVHENSYFGYFSYTSVSTAGENYNEVYFSNLWEVQGAKTMIRFDTRNSECTIPDQILFTNDEFGEVHIQSLENGFGPIGAYDIGTFNTCKGEIIDLPLVIYEMDGQRRIYDIIIMRFDPISGRASSHSIYSNSSRPGQLITNY